MDFSIITENLGLFGSTCDPCFVDGLFVTMELVGLALVFGLLLAVPMALLHVSKNPLLWGPVWFYVYVFRGTPLLVQMYIIYYGLGQFEAVQQSIFWPLLKEAYVCALIAFTLNTAAYTTEILRGAILATSFGEVEAAKACGMSRAMMLRRILLPSAFRRALPAYSNEVIFMLHGSAIASVITILDLTGVARVVNSRFYSPYEAFLTAAAFYMALTFVIVGLFKLWERRWFGHLRPREE